MTFRLTALTDPATGAHTHRLAWLASAPGGTPLGSAFLRLFHSAEQSHLAELSLDVHPAERRRGVGTALLAAARDAARADGRRVLLAPAAEGSPGDAFLTAHGFTRALVLEFTRLDLAGAPLPDAPLHPDYRLISWTGSCPGERLADFTHARTAMDDTPMGDTGFGLMVWDEERVLAAAKAVADRGELLFTVAAVETATDRIVGFTELVLPADRTGDAQHYGTGVLPAHRHRGLARAVKAETIRRTRAEHPRITGLLADTADHNTAMIATNHALGYRPTHRSVEFRLDL
ncbi:GNAT family N-acetyltransferase [Kitasatospora sp. NPDC088391]|uniref:GNAT family N-acetyltransferase n=1 Tax=Kitasatospora sp. NPDC088391 TaxID=3364074 RepID=UPI00380A3ECF